MPTVTVRKLDYTGQEKWRYQGELLVREPRRIVLQAVFDREEYPVHDLTLRKGDRFVETYFSDRWYNVYHIYAGEENRLKLVYCNIGYPAEFDDLTVSYRDLALDLIVYPDGRLFVLDEAEFEALPLSPEVRAQALNALTELHEKFRGKSPGQVIESF